MVAYTEWEKEKKNENSAFERCSVYIARLAAIYEAPDDDYVDGLKTVDLYARRLSGLLYQLTLLHACRPDDEDIAKERLRLAVSLHETRFHASDQYRDAWDHRIKAVQDFMDRYDTE